VSSELKSEPYAESTTSNQPTNQITLFLRVPPTTHLK